MNTNIDTKGLMKEAHRQLVGIKIIIYINIAAYIIVYFSWLVSTISTIQYYDGNIFIDSLSVNFFIGGVLILLVLTIIGFYKRFRYSLITARIILVLCCFSLVGLILVLAIFWNRLKNEDVRKWLNYQIK